MIGDDILVLVLYTAVNKTKVFFVFICDGREASWKSLSTLQTIWCRSSTFLRGAGVYLMLQDGVMQLWFSGWVGKVRSDYVVGDH